MQSSQRGRVCKKHVWCSFFSPFGLNALLKIFILKACTLEYDIYLRCRLLTKVLIWISGIFIIIRAYFCDRAASDVCRVFASFLANLFRPDDIQLSNPIKKKKDNPQMPKTCSPVLRSFKVLSSHVGCHLNFMNPCKGEKNTMCKEARLVILALLWMLILLSFSCWSCFV